MSRRRIGKIKPLFTQAPPTSVYPSRAPVPPWKFLSAAENVFLKELLLPFSCKRRGFCPSVPGAAHSPQPFKNRPSRVYPLSHPSQALPSPIPRLLSRPRCAWRWGALAGLPQRAGHAGRAMDGGVAAWQEGLGGVRRVPT